MIIQSRPTVGGWLTMLNCASWLLLILIARAVEPLPTESFVRGIASFALVFAMVSLSLPFGWILFLSEPLHGPTLDQIVFTSVIIGLNSFAWGYGLERLFWCRVVANHKTIENHLEQERDSP